MRTRSVRVAAKPTRSVAVPSRSTITKSAWMRAASIVSMMVSAEFVRDDRDCRRQGPNLLPDQQRLVRVGIDHHDGPSSLGELAGKDDSPGQVPDPAF